MTTVFILFAGGYEGGSALGVYSSRANAEQQMTLWVERENLWNTEIYRDHPIEFAQALRRGYEPVYDEDGTVHYDGNAGNYICIYEDIVDAPVELSRNPTEPLLED